MDQRDDQTWIIVGLNSLGEAKIVDGSLESTLRRDLGVQSDFPIFIPVLIFTKGKKQAPVYLMEGYVFVSSGLAETTYFSLERRPYVSQVVSSQGNMRVLHTVPNREIRELQDKLHQMVVADISEGDRITVIKGPYKNLEGTVMVATKESVVVQVLLRSLNAVVTIPSVCVEIQPVED